MTDFDVSTDDEVSETTDSHRSHSTQEDQSTAIYGTEEQAESKGAMLKSLRGDSSDEVDPRKLSRDPTLSEIRWYYRRTFANNLVEKPVKDAYKNGFDFMGDNAEEAQRLIDVPSFRQDGNFIDAHISAHIKARRDGFALVFIGVSDNTGGVHQSPIGDDSVQVDGISHCKVFTVDDLTYSATGTTHEQIRKSTGLERDDYAIRETGIVINTNIESPDYREPIGYVIDSHPPKFVHSDRMLHYTWNPEVDGNYQGHDVERWNDRDRVLGEWEGDSVLIPSYNLMKGISKGNWAIMQALFRDASHMYSVKLPPDASDDEFNAAMKETRNINAKSSLVFPSTDYEMDQHDSGSQMEPEQHFDVLFDQVCASHEMTKSVLFGTQSGTVSGSETDIKNYFNKVERLRGERFEQEIQQYLTRVKRMLDDRTEPDFEYETEIDWGPLFKVDEQTKIQMMQTAAQAMTTAIGQYVLTPDEARSILSEEFVEIDLDDLTERQKDELDRIRLATSGQGEHALASEEEYTEGPEAEEVKQGAGEENSRTGGQKGGRPEGAQQQSGPSGATGTDGVDEETIDRIAQKVAEKLQD